jgi:hypothetical protein
VVALWIQEIFAWRATEKDVLNRSRIVQYFAITAAWAGEKELASHQLETGVRAPGASTAVSYGALNCCPSGTRSAALPRFANIVTSPAPK